jgi:hypothetical protein
MPMIWQTLRTNQLPTMVVVVVCYEVDDGRDSQLDNKKAYYRLMNWLHSKVII